MNIKESIFDNNGQSIVDLIRGKKIPELPIFMETSQLIQKKANVVIGIRTPRYKYFRDSEDPNKRIHLYDLKLDPFENENISKQFPKIINELENILESILNYTFDKFKKETNDDDTKKIEDELKKWGYM